MSKEGTEVAYLQNRNYGKIISVIGGYVKNRVQFSSYAMHRFPLMTFLYFYLPYGTCTLKIVDTVYHWILPRNKSDLEITSVILRRVKLITHLEFQVQWNFDFTSSGFKFSLNLHYKFIVFMKGHKISFKIFLNL